MPTKKRALALTERIILAFLSVVFISLLISILFSYSLFLINLNQRIDPEVKNNSKVIEGELNNIKQKTLVFADIITRDKATVNFLKGDISKEEMINELRTINSRTNFDILQIIDANGIVKLRLEEIANVGDNKTNDPLVEKAFKGLKTTSFTLEDKKQAIVASVPIEDNGNISGVLLTGYTTTGNNILAAIDGESDKALSFFDISGNLISTNLRNPNGTPLTEQKVDKASLNNIIYKKESAIEEIAVGKNKYRALYDPLKDFNGNLVGVRMTALSLGPIMADNTKTVVTLIVANLVTILIAYVIASRSAKNLVNPILKIKKGTELIGLGNLDYKIDIKTGDEVEELAESFNRMGLKLKSLVEEVSLEKDTASAERNKFSVVLEGVLDGIFTLDFERRITLMNKAAQEITGLRERDVLGKKCDEVLILFKNKARLSASDFCPLIPVDMDQVVFSEKNLKLVTPRRELFISMTSAVIKESKIANLGCIVTFRDSTKERELEEMKLDFVSMAAHELRTPLTSIRGYVALLEPKLKEKVTDDEMKFLERISISSNQLATLVENLLDVSKIEHNTLELDIKKEAWGDIVKNAIETFYEQAKQKDLTLRLIPAESPSPFPHAAVDKFRIAEVISNLVANAINYTEPGGTIEVSTGVENNMIKTWVKDTGNGIPERSLPHLFTKFYRVSGVLGQGSKGTGLGLYISKSIVNMHKGDIWVESKLGVGSTFYFTVPIFEV